MRLILIRHGDPGRLHLIEGSEPVSESGYFTKLMQEPPFGRR